MRKILLVCALTSMVSGASYGGGLCGTLSSTIAGPDCQNGGPECYDVEVFQITEGTTYDLTATTDAVLNEIISLKGQMVSVTGEAVPIGPPYIVNDFRVSSIKPVEGCSE